MEMLLLNEMTKVLHSLDVKHNFDILSEYMVV